METKNTMPIPANNVIYLKKQFINQDGITHDIYKAFLLDIDTKDLMVYKPDSVTAKAITESGTNNEIVIRRKKLLKRSDFYEICDLEVDYPLTPYLNISIGEDNEMFSGEIKPFSTHKGQHPVCKDTRLNDVNVELTLAEILQESHNLTQQSLKKALESKQEKPEQER